MNVLCPPLASCMISSCDSRPFHAPTFAAYGFSGFFPKTSLATPTAVTALGQPA